MKKFLGIFVTIIHKVGVSLHKAFTVVVKFLKNNPVSKFLVTPKGVRAVVWVCFVIALFEVAFAVLIYGYNSTDKITVKAAAIVPYPITAVNEGFISYNQFMKERDYIHHFYSSAGQEGLDFEAIDKEILNQLIENRLVSFEAFLYGIGVKKSEIDATLDQIIEQNGGAENVAKVLDDLYGLDVDQFKKLVKTQLLRDKMNTDLMARVTAQHILVRVPAESPQEKVDEAKTKIEGYRTEINNGLDFAEAAKKYSEDTGSAEQGGKLEPFSEGEMVPEFSKAAFAANIGEVTEPIKTDFGWHIIKVEKKTGKINNNFIDWLAAVKKNSLIIKLI